MANSNAGFNAPEPADVRFVEAPVAAATKLFFGTMGARNTDGDIVPASDAAGLSVVGRVEADVDNSGGEAGDKTALVKRTTCWRQNSAGDAIGAGDLGKVCYVEDDATVNKTGGVNHIKAGLALQLSDDASEVLVDHALAPAL